MLVVVNGVTVMVAVTISELEFTGLKEVIVPEPAAASPIEVVLFVQL